MVCYIMNCFKMCIIEQYTLFDMIVSCCHPHTVNPVNRTSFRLRTYDWL